MGYIQLKDVKLTETESTRGGKTFDVIKDNSWSASKLNENIIKQIPSVELVEYELSLGAVYQSLRYWFDSMSTVGSEESGEKIYENLYKANETGVRYVLPYFSQSFWSTSQTWSR